MGDVITFRPRPGSPIDLAGRVVADGTDVAGTDAGTPNVPTGTDLDSTDTRPAPAPRVPRPEWLGVRRTHRRAAVAAVSRFLRALGSRLVFELVQGIPRRAWRLLRWFARGVIGHRDTTGTWIGGWVGLIGWCFAARERADARNLALESPGGQIRATQHADHIAVVHAAVVVVPHFIGAIVLHHYALPWWLIFAPLVVGTTIYGYRTDPKPPAPLAVPREPGNLTIDAINEALRAVNILTKPGTQNPHPDGVRLAKMPRAVGQGQEAVIDLPASVKASAADVIKERERIAASLAVPASQLVIEPGDHAGRVVLWCADRDPFTRDPETTPLLDHASWSVFDRVPFGHDPRSEPVAAPLFETHWLIGGLPGSGKTSAARAVTAAAVLDPRTELFVFDGKQGSDWHAIERAAAMFDAGPIRDQAAHLRALLERFLDEGDQRFHTLRTLPAARCPDNRLTPELAADGMPFRLLVVDEFHRHLADETHGGAITRLLVDYVKGYRACGYGLLLATQDTGSDIADRFTSLRRVIGTRYALRVMDWQASNMILGDQMNTRGHDASLILPAQRGTGILRTDLETDTGITRLARTVRCYYMGAAEWAAVCDVGANLRQVTAAATQVDAGPVYATPSQLYRLLNEHAPDVLDQVDATDAHSMGMRLPIKTEPHKVDRRRVYDLRRVEVALRLSPGCLGDVSELPPAGYGDDDETVPSQVGGTPEPGGEPPFEPPTFLPTGTDDEET